MKKYPLISGAKNHKKNTSACCKCGALGRYKVTIECSYMRGEDDVVWACEEHKKDVEFLYFDKVR